MIICIDIGGSSIKHCIVDKGKIINKKKSKVYQNDINLFTKQLENIITVYQNSYYVKGIAISAPGSVDSKAKIISGQSAVPCILRNNWITNLETKFNLPISVINDANAAVYAEHKIGNGLGKSNVVTLTFGSGIGGGIVINNELITGKDNYGGEFGQAIVIKNEKIITVSGLIATRALIKRVNKITPVKTDEEIFKLLKTDKKVKKLMDEYYNDIALVLFNLNHTLNPGILLIGGAISQQEEFVGNIKKAYSNFTTNHNLNELDVLIKPCNFYNDANLLGSYEYFKTKNSKN